MTLIERFLSKIQLLKSRNLKYRQPGDGSDGTCDCIGLIIGALKMIGISWKGDGKHSAIHGSNYAARYQMASLRYISDASQLSVADIVYKAHDPVESKYNLPGRYKNGGSYYNGDMNDYYHVGVVTSINPLNITHMTSPTVKVDKKLGKWSYAGKLRVLSSEAASTVQTPAPIPISNTENALIGTVVSPNGGPVKMRQKPSTLCVMWDKIIPGTVLTVLEYGEEWCKVSNGRRKGWYMMTKFIKIKEAS